MRCPACKHETLWEGNPFRPFCSERCKLIDLDNWLSERYRIEAREEEESIVEQLGAHEAGKENRD